MKAKTTPVHIFLQWNGDAEPEDHEPCVDEVTWSEEQIFTHDVEYIRADRVKALLHAVKLLAQPCTRADYTVAMIDDEVCKIAQKAIDDYSDCAKTGKKHPLSLCQYCGSAERLIDGHTKCSSCEILDANTESKVRLVPITSCYQCHLRDSITCICNLTGKQHTPPWVAIPDWCPLEKPNAKASERVEKSDGTK